MPGPSGTTPAASSSVCWTAELAGSILGSEGAAGTVYLDLALTNTSGESCTVRGFPGVSFVDAQGGQLGAAADRNGAAGESISLAPGQQAVAMLGVTQPGVLPGCDAGQTTQPASLLIYPPDNRDPLRVPVSSGTAACTGSAVHQLKVATLELAG
jgi:hypothetical protein